MKYKTLTRLLVRGFGLVMIAQGLPACASAGLTIGVQVLGNDPVLSGSSWGLWQLATALDVGTRLLVGGILFLKPNWVVNLLIPSNRPYCHECGYELSGLTPEGECPECGTAYKMPTKRPSAPPE